MRSRVFWFLVPAAASAALLAVWGLSASRTDVSGSPSTEPPLYAEKAPALPADYEPTPPPMPAELELKQIYTLNLSSFVPPQCYTKTTDEQGKVHNPCYTCHVSSREPNFINDADIQLEYAFVPRARKNAWKNIFIDWRPAIAKVTDQEIIDYVRQSNYFDAEGNIILQTKLVPPPAEWDHGEDGRWSGYVPDATFNFDREGFDRLPDGKDTGWRALAYYPLPGTFFPTNGSMGDVLVRLPSAFRERSDGKPDRAIYKLNLAIVESVVTRRSIPIDEVDEQSVEVDLDQDGKLGRAREVKFTAVRDEPSTMSYVGRARADLIAERVHLAAGLFPEGTEFLHTVRYLDPTEEGIGMAARLKELRYARKVEWWSYARLDKRARVEAIAKEDSPSELRNFGGNIEIGVNNNQGWTFQGFIEDAVGGLRPQSFEETTYCIGCHGGTGVADDAIFSFSRRFGDDAFQKGWYHWTQRGLEGVPDRKIHSETTEYVNYLVQNGAGDEFRQNSEVIAKFFDAQGKLRPEMQAKLEQDVSELLIPSRERALALNKAYRELVKLQTFRHGREIVLDGAKQVHRLVPEDTKTGIVEPALPPWGVTTLVATSAE